MVPIQTARAYTDVGTEREQQVLERKLDTKIRSLSEQGFSGFTKHEFVNPVLTRGEVWQVLNKYKQAGYKARLHLGGRHNAVNISIGWDK